MNQNKYDNIYMIVVLVTVLGIGVLIGSGWV